MGQAADEAGAGDGSNCGLRCPDAQMSSPLLPCFVKKTLAFRKRRDALPNAAATHDPLEYLATSTIPLANQRATGT